MPDEPNFCLLVATTSASTSACGEWSPIGPPGARDGIQGVYDSARSRLVVFGGEGPGGHADPLGDTWEWDGTTWRRMATTGPLARGGYGIAYDSLRHRVVLFGGNNGSTLLDDTWEWDGLGWSSVTPTGARPSARYTHSMAFDASIGRTVLYGGFGGGAYLSDTWEWDGATWTPSTGGPSPARVGAALAYDIDRGGLFLFGGYNGTVNLNDTWQRIGSAWSSVPTNNRPPVRRYGALARDTSTGTTSSGKLLLFGGRGTAASLADLWMLSGDTWVTLPTGPEARTNFASDYDSARSRFVVFGGSGGPYFNNTWTWDGATWLQTAAGAPLRTYGAAAFDSRRGEMITHGGFDASDNLMGDTWTWNGANWNNRSASGPSPRYGHAMVFDPSADAGNGRAVMFGGYNGTVLNSEMWLWDGTSWTSRAFAGPTARYQHSMVYDSDRGVIVLHGGYDGLPGGNPGDTWEFTPGDYSSPIPGTWVRKSTSGISPPRVSSAMAYDPVRHVTVQFGGNYNATNYGDTNLWNGTAWSSPVISGPTPPARANHTMVFDAQRGAVILFGGYRYEGVDAIALHDTWEWTGSAWRLVSTDDSPSARYTYSMVYDTVHDRIIVHGGNRITGWSLSDTWTFGAGPPTAAIGPQSACGLGTAAISVPSVPPGVLTFRWRKNGANLDNQPGHLAGVTSPMLTVSIVTSADAGSYDCVMTNECGPFSSTAAHLSGCSADANCDTQITPADVAAFVNAWFTSLAGGTLAGDFDGNGSVQPADVAAFVATWFNAVTNGC